MRPKAIRSVLALSALGLLVLLGTVSPAPLRAQQPGGLPALEKRVAALEALLSARSQELATLQAALEAERTARLAADAALANRATSLEGKTRYLSVVGTETYLTGTNLHIRNGLGATNGSPAGGPAEVNGLGNLIVGYNEQQDEFFQRDRSGSHNLVVGRNHGYSSYGGLLAGYNNDLQGPYASVTGGVLNTAASFAAAVGGGRGNRATGNYSNVSGGDGNTAGGETAVVSGGNDRRAPGLYDWAAGGFFQDF